MEVAILVAILALATYLLVFRKSDSTPPTLDVPDEADLGVVVVSSEDLMKLKKVELVELAEAAGIRVLKNDTKTVLVEKILIGPTH